MSKKAERPQRARHILVYDEDWAYLESVYGRSGQGTMGVGPAIRQLIHAWVSRQRARASTGPADPCQESPNQ